MYIISVYRDTVICRCVGVCDIVQKGKGGNTLVMLHLFQGQESPGDPNLKRAKYRPNGVGNEAGLVLSRHK